MRQLTTEAVAEFVSVAAKNVLRGAQSSLVTSKMGGPAKQGQAKGPLTANQAALAKKQKLAGVGRNPNVAPSQQGGPPAGPMRLAANKEHEFEGAILWELKRNNALNEILDADGNEMVPSEEKKDSKKEDSKKKDSKKKDSKKEDSKNNAPVKIEKRGTNRTPITQKARDKEALRLRQGRLKDSRENKGVKTDFKSKKKVAKEEGRLKYIKGIAAKGGKRTIAAKAVGRGLLKTAKFGAKTAVTAGTAGVVAGGAVLKGVGTGAGNAIAGTAKGAGHAIGGTAKGLGDVAKSGADTVKSGADVTKAALGTGSDITKKGIETGGSVLKHGASIAAGGLGRVSRGIGRTTGAFTRAVYKGSRNA